MKKGQAKTNYKTFLDTSSPNKLLMGQILAFYKLCDLLAPLFQKVQLICVNPFLLRLKLQPPYTIYQMQGAREKLPILLVSEKAVSCIVKNVTQMICQLRGPKFIKLSENITPQIS